MHPDTLITILVQILVAGFVYGRLTERVKGQGEKIVTLESDSKRHEREIGELFGHARINRH
jgi:hypothetical protein